MYPYHLLLFLCGPNDASPIHYNPGVYFQVRSVNNSGRGHIKIRFGSDYNVHCRRCVNSSAGHGCQNNQRAAKCSYSLLSLLLLSPVITTATHYIQRIKKKKTRCETDTFITFRQKRWKKAEGPNNHPVTRPNLTLHLIIKRCVAAYIK